MNNYDVIRVKYRGTWFGSKSEGRYAVLFSLAGKSFRAHPDMVHCRPDFQVYETSFVDFKEREYKGNVTRLIDFSREKNAQMVFVGCMPYEATTYDDFMDQVKSRIVYEDDFTTYSFYKGGKCGKNIAGRNGALMFERQSDSEVKLHFVSTNMTQSQAELMGVDVDLTLALYRMAARFDEWDDCFYEKEHPGLYCENEQWLGADSDIMLPELISEDEVYL